LIPVAQTPAAAGPCCRPDPAFSLARQQFWQALSRRHAASPPLCASGQVLEDQRSNLKGKDQQVAGSRSPRGRVPGCSGGCHSQGRRRKHAWEGSQVFTRRNALLLYPSWQDEERTGITRTRFGRRGKAVTRTCCSCWAATQPGLRMLFLAGGCQGLHTSGGPELRPAWRAGEKAEALSRHVKEE